MPEARRWSFRVTLQQAGLVHAPGFAGATKAQRRDASEALLTFALEEKDRDLAAGLDKAGQPLIPITQYTREHRHSEMGPADPWAPVFTPSYSLSRTRSLLTGTSGDGYADLFWKYDRHTGASWGKILDYHAKGLAVRGKVRDVIGIGPAAVGRIAFRLRSWWEQYVRGLVGVPEPLPPQPPAVPPRFTVRTVKAYVPQFPELAVAKNNRRVSQLAVNGKVYTLGATAGPRSALSAASLRRGIVNGSFSGFAGVDQAGVLAGRTTNTRSAKAEAARNRILERARAAGVYRGAG